MAIVRIRHKGLKALFQNGTTGLVGKNLQANAAIIMDFLDVIATLSDCDGVKDFHPLKGERKGQYAISVSGNWRIVFNIEENIAGVDVTILNLEDYH